MAEMPLATDCQLFPQKPQCQQSIIYGAFRLIHWASTVAPLPLPIVMAALAQFSIGVA